MFRRPVPTIPTEISQAQAASLATMAPLFGALDLDLDARVAALLHRWHPDRVAEERDAAEDARVAAEADALADAIDAGDCDADGEPIPYPTYRSV
jgi:hypothetical protein